MMVAKALAQGLGQSWCLRNAASGGLPWWLTGKEPACRCRRHRFDPWLGKIPYASEQVSLCTTTNEAVR